MTQASFTQPDAELRERFEEFRREHMSLAPGEASDLHTHENDYYLIMLQGDRVAGISKDGSEDIVLDIPPGPNAFRIEKGGTEWAYNHGTEPFYEMLIELKK